jgi:hypothetical protein
LAQPLKRNGVICTATKGWKKRHSPWESNFRFGSRGLEGLYLDKMIGQML